MKITEAIAQHITEAVEGVNWTEVDLKNVLADVSFEEAATLTNASTNTIAAIVYHLNYYNIKLLERVKGITNPVNASNGFDMQVLKNAEEWNVLRKENITSTKALAVAVSAFPEEKLFDINPANGLTFYKNLHGCVEHIYYHLGQIFILKTLIRNGNK
jgi:hypothetical protein